MREEAPLSSPSPPSTRPGLEQTVARAPPTGARRGSGGAWQRADTGRLQRWRRRTNGSGRARIFFLSSPLAALCSFACVGSASRCATKWPTSSCRCLTDSMAARCARCRQGQTWRRLRSQRRWPAAMPARRCGPSTLPSSHTCNMPDTLPRRSWRPECLRTRPRAALSPHIACDTCPTADAGSRRLRRAVTRARACSKSRPHMAGGWAGTLRNRRASSQFYRRITARPASVAGSGSPPWR